jgi:hypothetical protein
VGNTVHSEDQKDLSIRDIVLQACTTDVMSCGISDID